MISDAPSRSEGEREVSEGHGLGEERLRGWCTKEREESGGADQIPMNDGAPMLGRAMGNVDSGRRRSTQVTTDPMGARSELLAFALGNETPFAITCLG
jgi:hypothetical protein